jgi:hypothetical protein
MTTLMSTLALVMIIAFSLAAGIGAGYVLIITILNAFNPNRTSKRETPQLATSTSRS